MDSLAAAGVGLVLVGTVVEGTALPPRGGCMRVGWPGWRGILGFFPFVELVPVVLVPAVGRSAVAFTSFSVVAGDSVGLVSSVPPLKTSLPVFGSVLFVRAMLSGRGTYRQYVRS